MPPMIRYTSDAVLSAAFDLVRRSGLSALNARAVAQELGSSTQPIFRLFSGMDELRTGVLQMAKEFIANYIRQALKDSTTPYLTLGMTYVRFARDESELFKALFMRDRGPDACETIFPIPDELIKLAQENTTFTAEQAENLHNWLWIFTHGLAVSIATRACCFSEERLLMILTGAYEAATLKMRQDIELQNA